MRRLAIVLALAGAALSGGCFIGNSQFNREFVRRNEMDLITLQMDFYRFWGLTTTMATNQPHEQGEPIGVQ